MPGTSVLASGHPLSLCEVAAVIVFLDTEFTDFIDCELVSIGMVTENGRQFYAEVLDFDRAKCTEFVRSAVLPLLGQLPDTIVMRAELGAALHTWFAELAVPVTIAIDYSADWELLVHALDGELPASLVGRLDLASIAESAVFALAAAGYHAAPGRPWHHALHDARGMRAGFLAVESNALQARIPETDRRGRRTHVELSDIPAPYHDEFTTWLASKPKHQAAADASAVRRSAWREWLVLRFSER
ncbi:conserved hypothetical protein [Cupriavidus necator]|uniref:Uncharacterized protein n=1 Tax=Cupriavidus necator TaxID=106590 RepID=A0A1K0IQU5_CUPNE|nr:conserved hypothetical protein [Cupriavidus necator]